MDDIFFVILDNSRMSIQVFSFSHNDIASDTPALQFCKLANALTQAIGAFPLSQNLDKASIGAFSIGPNTQQHGLAVLCPPRPSDRAQRETNLLKELTNSGFLRHDGSIYSQ
ncbi:hypothetical protein A9973_09760 [Achromobacter sp. UMC46]|nr:hypothetical protein [Achromobacter sp. UMC46]